MQRKVVTFVKNATDATSMLFTFRIYHTHIKMGSLLIDYWDGIVLNVL